MKYSDADVKKAAEIIFPEYKKYDISIYSTENIVGTNDDERYIYTVYITKKGKKEELTTLRNQHIKEALKTLSKTYGYARISTLKQKVQRQIDNIRREYPDALIITEEYTGTTTDRPKLNKLLKTVKAGDTIVFDEVSRMSRNAEDGVKLYEDLFDNGINLVFIKEPHINTSVYRDKLDKQIEKLNSTGSKATDKLLDSIMAALHEYTIDLAKEQIEIAFRTAQAEVDFLHQRTSEGVRKAMDRYDREELEGLPHVKNRVGRKKGITLTTKKSIKAKEEIRKHSKDFDGTLNDIDCMKIVGVNRNTYYKYKREMRVS